MKTSNSKSQLVTVKSKCIHEEKTSRQKSYTNSANSSKQYRVKTSVQLKAQQLGIKQQTIITKNQQLFSIIETFYNTLCNLPLEKLITSSEPDAWIKDQELTLEELFKKLQKIGKHKEYEYYRWKLQSVNHILDNIKENMTMLQRINHLKNYNSGTDSSNYRSRGSSSCQSEPRQVKLGDLTSGRTNAKEMLSYDQYIINAEKKQTKRQSPEIMAQTVNSQEQSSQNDQPLSRSQMFQKTKQPNRQRIAPKQGQNRNLMNLPKQMSNNSGMPSYRTNQLKDKTLVKMNNSKPTSSQRTLSNYTAEGRFLEDRIRHGMHEQISNSIKIQNKQLNTMQASKVQSSNQYDSHNKSIDPNQYVEMIKELRLQILNKDKQIERLLINQQEYEQGIEIYGQREKQKNNQILFLKQNITHTNKQKEKLQLQIKRLLQLQEQMRQTIKFQRDRNKREEKEKEKIEEKYYNEANSRDQLLDQIKQLQETNKQCRKNERVMKQKLQVYTKKYFKVYRQLQQSKQTEKMCLHELEQLKNKNFKGPSRYEQIASIVEYHKSRLCDDSMLD